KRRVRVDARRLERFLGPAPFRSDVAGRADRVGAANGMAYTEVGGSTIAIEVSVAPGKGNLALTGKLGDVMKESAQAGFSYLRSRAQALGIPPDFHERMDVHVH